MNRVIKDQSIVIVEKIESLDNIKNGTIVVALINGYATVKRIYIDNNIVTLMPDSDSKLFVPTTIDTGYEEINIIGKVIWHMNPDDVEKYYWT